MNRETGVSFYLQSAYKENLHESLSLHVISFPDNTTGSSSMPHKKNFILFELVRRESAIFIITKSISFTNR